MGLGLFLAALAAYCGLAAGLIVAYFAREELEVGKKHFAILAHTVLMALILVCFTISPWLSLVLLALLLASYWVELNWAVYPVLAMALISAQMSAEFFVIAALSFVYGLPVAALSYSKGWRVLVYNLGFVAIALFLL